MNVNERPRVGNRFWIGIINALLLSFILFVSIFALWADAWGGQPYSWGQQGYGTGTYQPFTHYSFPNGGSMTCHNLGNYVHCF